MNDWDVQRVAAAAGAEIVRAAAGPGPARTVIDSREAAGGDLFVGIAGERADGGAFAAQVLQAGAWGVLVTPEHARADLPGAGAVLAVADPVRSLGELARAWRRELAAQVIAITGSVGKTSTKDLTAALIAPYRRTAASRENFNTEIGLPLEILAAPTDTEVLVLELAMRGPGQIAELAAICEPNVGVITNIGPVHLELLGSIEAIAAAKAELLAGLAHPPRIGIVPAKETLLEPYLPDAWMTFGPGGTIDWEGDTIVNRGNSRAIDVQFPTVTAAHQRTNALAAVAAALAIGVWPSGPVDVTFSRLRGERIVLPGGAEVINDCYNANPLSMRAALDDLAAQDPAGRRVAVLGDMLELGPEALRLHEEIGAHAAQAGVDVLITVGPLAAAMGGSFGGTARAVPDASAAAQLVGELVEPGDLILVKGSRGVGLEVVAQALQKETET